jgi:hypothetical protein
MLINDGYAVLIGVDDYSAYDASRKLPKGTTSLSGSLNDVKVWWKQCRLLGLTPAQIRVLTSPQIDYKELAGATSENVGTATEAEIRATVNWLGKKLGQASQPTGLLTYSGHGDWLADKGPVVCPSDVTFVEGAGGAIDLAHALSYDDLNALVGRRAADNLTIVLDCCHSGSSGAGESTLAVVSTSRGKPLTLTSRAAPAGSGPQTYATQLVGRSLRAAGMAQLAYQSMFDGVPRGAFSWSLTSAMEQWREVQAGQAVRLDVSYGKLLETSRRLLGALWFPQTPALHGPHGLAGLAVFQQGLTATPGQTAPRPDGARRPLEVDSGLDVWRQYTLTFNDSNSTVFGTIIIVNSDIFTGFTIGTEYWYLNKGSFTLLGDYGLNITYADNGEGTTPQDPGYSSEQAFTITQDPSPGWGSGWTTDPVSGGYLFSGRSPAGSYLRVGFAGRTGDVGTITWYQVLASGSPADYTPSGSWGTGSGSVSVPSGSTGYDICQTVTPYP